MRTEPTIRFAYEGHRWPTTTLTFVKMLVRWRDTVLAQVQLLCHLPVGATGGHQPEHLHLARLVEHGRDREAVELAVRQLASHMPDVPTAERARPVPRKEKGMTTIESVGASVDFAAIKTRQQGVWASGDYAVIGTPLQIVAEELCEAVDVAAGWRVLDVAAGNGNAALAAARRGCEVTATDYVPELLDRLQVRAAAEGVRIETRTADAEALDLPGASFDAVVSTFGVMFAPDQDRAGAELVRVCRPGGRIGLANWTPDSFVGDMLRTVGRYVPPPTGVRSPLEWGTEPRVGDLLGAEVSTARTTERAFVFRYRSPDDWLDVFRTYYGPFVHAFAALDDSGQEALAGELVALAAEHNRATDGTLRVPSTYLEIVATKGR